MVTRAILSKQLIDGIDYPEAGERWVADTQLRGFGLRIWSTGLAYGIRVSNSAGKSIRRTISYWELLERSSLRYRRHFTGLEVSIGDLVDDARRWASDEIDLAKGRPTLADEREEQHQAARKYAATLSFERASQLRLKAMAYKGVSQAYRDRLDKLFALHVPERLRRKKLLRVTEREVLSLLCSNKLSPGNRRLLRPYLGQVFDVAHVMHARPKVSSYHVRDFDLPDDEAGAPQTFVRKQKREWFYRLFSRLESEQENWQQALCLRLYFDFHAPLSRLMGAKWSELKDYHYRSRLDPEEEFFRREWRFSRKLLGRQTISQTQNPIIEIVRARSGASLFWFPSPIRSRRHIRSVDHIWRLMLHEFDLPYMSPRAFKIAFDSVRYRRWWDEGDTAHDPRKSA